MGRINLASSVPYHASQLYARNITAFLLHLVKDGKLNCNLADEIVRDTLLTRDGEMVNARVREFFGMAALQVRVSARKKHGVESHQQRQKDNAETQRCRRNAEKSKHKSSVVTRLMRMRRDDVGKFARQFVYFYAGGIYWV